MEIALSDELINTVKQILVDTGEGNKLLNK
jgi:hypothetical protein